MKKYDLHQFIFRINQKKSNSVEAILVIKIIIS